MRRDARHLALPAALTALVLLAVACGNGTPHWNPVPPTDYGDHPAAVDATAFDTRWPIKHVVFIIKENRTFDNLYGLFPGANGATTGMDGATERPLTQAADRLTEDIKHCYPCALQAYDHGKMDGFGSVSAAAERYAYTQYQPTDLPAYWQWAKDFVLGDNFFASAQGPSFPNHLFTIAATSGGTHDNPVQDLGQLRARHQDTGLFKPWGCDSLPDSYVPVVDSEGRTKNVPPCFDFKTEGDLLNGASIPWAYYAATQYQNGYLWSAYDAVRHVRANEAQWQQHIFGVDGLIGDIKGGLLPPVTWVTPRFELSEHPEYSFCQGQKLVDARDRRDHEQPHVEGHRDLPHVRRLRRLLRPRAAPAGGRVRIRDSACLCCSSAPTRERATWITRRASSPACSDSSRTTGTFAAHQARHRRAEPVGGLRLRPSASPARPTAGADRLPGPKPLDGP